jgi:hypothetical protein
MSGARIVAFVAALVAGARAFAPPAGRVRAPALRRFNGLDPELEEAVKTRGVEGGLFSIFRSDGDGASKGASAKALLKEYGVAYLATSISLALVSFGVCYALVDSGVDVAALLKAVNIDATSTAEKGTTVAIAYACHKAASPIRFPPTVALTPVVAKLLKREPSAADGDDDDDDVGGDA